MAAQLLTTVVAYGIGGYFVYAMFTYTNRQARLMRNNLPDTSVYWGNDQKVVTDFVQQPQNRSSDVHYVKVAPGVIYSDYSGGLYELSELNLQTERSPYAARPVAELIHAD
jgi:hypothetical protein